MTILRGLLVIAALAVESPSSARLPAAALSGAAAVRADENDDVVLEILGEHHEADGGSRARVRDRLLELGSPAAASIFRILCGRIQGEPPAAGVSLLDRPRRELLFEALRSWPRDRVVDAVVAEIRRGSSLGEQIVAIEVLGECGQATSLDALVELTEYLEPAHKRHPRVMQKAEAALHAILERDATAYGELAQLAQELDISLAPIVPGALGRTGAGESLTVLEDLLGKDNRLDVAVLKALGEIGPWEPESLSGACAGVLTDQLDSWETDARRQAALSLGRLGEAAAAPALVELLGDSDARVRSAALWSLHRLVGLHWAEDKERWQDWLERENAWLAERCPELLASLRADAPGPAKAALRELAQHPLHRRHLTLELSSVLEGADPMIAMSTCGTLARLGDPGAVPLLVDRLVDAPEGVRAAAMNALRILTGEAGPATAAEWRDLLGD